MSFPIVTFIFHDTDADIITYRSWSPHTYSIHNIPQHPALHPEFNSFLERIINQLEILPTQLFGQWTEHGTIIDIDIDYTHSTLLNDRPDNAYVLTLRNRIISPIIFSEDTANHLLNIRRELFDTPDNAFCIKNVIHNRI
jgi:hypothetical protein